MTDDFWEMQPWKDRNSEELAIRCYVSTNAGALDINDHKVYELGAGSRNSKQVSFRKQEIKSSYVPGSFSVNHQKDNVIENLEIYVSGTDWHHLQVALGKLEDAFTQPEYYVKWHVEEHAEIWRCWPSDYTIESSRELTHSRMAKFMVQCMRYPEFVDYKYDIQSPNAVPR